MRDELLPLAESRQTPPAATPCRRSHRQITATVGLQELPALTVPGANRCTTTGMSNSTKNCTRTCGISAVFCTVCTVSASLWHNRNVQHEEDELNLRHLQLRTWDCWNLSLKNRDTAGISTVFCTVVHSECKCSTNNWNVHHSVDEQGERHGEPPFSVFAGDGHPVFELHRRLRPPHPPASPSLWPTRRHHSLGQVSTRRVHAHGLKLPGEAQPMIVRRCTYHRRHTPVLADPSGAPGTACRPAKAEIRLRSESRRPPPAPTPTPTPSPARPPQAPWSRHKPPESMD